MHSFDLIVIGAGPSGMMSAIEYAKNYPDKNILILEQMDTIAKKLKASGGGRCNLSNQLPLNEFIGRFDKNARFIQDALKLFYNQDLIDFFQTIQIPVHSPDGYRIFPKTHDSQTVINGFTQALAKLQIRVKCSVCVDEILINNSKVTGVRAGNRNFEAQNIIVATGGVGYPKLGGRNQSFDMIKDTGHTITSLYPAMLPLITKETWVKSCRADTLPKVQISIDSKKIKLKNAYKNIKVQGDLIFSDKGIRGPVVLDFARYITPLLHEHSEVPILINIKNMNEEALFRHIKDSVQKNPQYTTLKHIETLLPRSVSLAVCRLCGIDPEAVYKSIEGKKKEALIKTLHHTPLTITAHEGFNRAMVTRGGVNLKEVDPKTLQSKMVQGLYFCGEVLDIDGPCGGYNLQWAFSSGNLAGKLKPGICIRNS
jgi:predicted Rossmann fold flavoprotein